MWVEAALRDDPEGRVLATDNCVQLGERFEVDVDALGQINESAAACVSEFCSKVRAGQSEPFVGLIAEHTQVTGGAGKRDLREIFEAFTSHPGSSVLIGEILSSTPDLELIAAIAQSQGGSVDTEGDLVVSVWFEPEGWDSTLGGLPWPGEYARGFVISAAHAKWRDRSLRRLSNVQVLAACK